MKQKIILNQDFDLEQLKKEIDMGGKFVVYQYCISIFFAVTLQRFSSPNFIPSGTKDENLRRKYNIISKLFGWWGIPWGPIYTTRSIRINNNGGIDVTNDIIINLDKESLLLREVEMVKVSEIFEKPDKWDLKAFNKSLKFDFETNPNYKEIHIGLFINTEENVEPYYVIGINANINFEEAVNQVKKSLYKQFRKHIFFDFIDISIKNEVSDDLKNQGIRIA